MDKCFYDMREASKLTGMSISSLYKLTSNRLISFYKPFGKKIFFTEEQLQGMMVKNLMKSRDEIANDAIAELAKNRKGGYRND